MSIPPTILPFWTQFAAATGTDPTPRFHEAFHFHDNESGANELAALVLAGKKRATASLLWTFEAQHTPPPQSGSLGVVLNWAGTPQCVIETTAIDVVPFEDVTAEFAALEGEGDGTLRFWREAHWGYFGRQCGLMSKQPSLRMPVLCERFRVVYPLPQSSPSGEIAPL